MNNTVKYLFFFWSAQRIQKTLRLYLQLYEDQEHTTHANTYG